MILLMVATMNSCTDQFEEINTNPNAPIEVQTEFLLRQVIYDFGEQMSYEGFVAGNLLGQYFTAVDFNLFDRHSLSEPQFGGNPWPILYHNLRDNEIILQNSLSNEIDKVYEGPARILKAYMMAMTTDLFGDAPYTEALKGKSNVVTPSYDTQEDIYMGSNGILEQLDLANTAIDNYQGVISLEGDLFFGGDLQAWKRMANALKLKYLMRISNKVEVATEIQSLVNEGALILENNANATFQFADGPPNNFRLATARVGDFNLFILSETMEEILKDLNDPRIATYFRPTSSDPSSYKGLLNGPNASDLSISIADFSLSGTVFREETSALQANFITAWEVEFLLAEAALKGYTNGDAKTHYDKAVQLAFEYWQTELPSDYLSEQAAFDSNGADPLEQIITQKWIAQIINGYEGWIEYRRTGFPELKTISASLNNNLIPVRMPYPADEATLNTINFNDASNRTEGNSINAKVWWDLD
jgi:hypothetical protein